MTRAAASAEDRSPDGAAAGPSRLRRLVPWLALAAAVVATGVLVAVRSEEREILAQLDAWSLAALLAMQFVYLTVQSGRFQVVLAQLAERPIPFLPWLRLFVLGRFLNLFVPQSGNLYRALACKARFDVSYVRFVAAFVNAPWIAMVLNFALGAVAVAALQADAALFAVPLWSWLTAATLATAAGPLLAALILPLFPTRFAWAAWAARQAREMLQATLTSLRSPRYLALVTAWTVAAFVQAALMIWLAFAALGVPAGVAEAIAFYVLLQLATYLPITPGNLGVQELAFAGLSTGMGGGAVDGVAISALLRVTGVATLLAASLPLGGIEALRVARAQERPW